MAGHHYRSVYNNTEGYSDASQGVNMDRNAEYIIKHYRHRNIDCECGVNYKKIMKRSAYSIDKQQQYQYT